MRILHVTQSYYPFLDRGGPAVKVRAMARGLARRGHRVTVLTSDLGLRHLAQSGDAAGSLGDADRFTEDRWGWRGAPPSGEDSGGGSPSAVYLSTLASYRALTWNPGAFAWLREHLAQFDVAHLFGFYDLLGPAAARACRRAGVPFVLEPMGMFRPIVRSLALKRVYHRLLGATMARATARLIATSPQEQAELIAEGLPAARIVVRRNGIEPPQSLPPRGAFRRARGIPGDARLVLFLGRLVGKKSPELLLEAFADWQSQLGEAQASPAPPRQRPPAVLVFAGPEEDVGYRRALEARARRLALDHQVLFTGPLYDQAKWSAYRDADLFVLPSQNENFGNAAAEAIVCGTPVLVTDCCGIAPLIAPPAGDNAGVVVPHDRIALAAALARLLDAPELLERLRGGCPAVAASLDWDEPLAETEALYAAVVRDNPSKIST